MENEPLLPSQSPPTNSPPSQSPLPFNSINPNSLRNREPTTSAAKSSLSPSLQNGAVADFSPRFNPPKPQFPNPQFKSSSIIRQAIFFLSLYLILGIAFYSVSKDNFSGVKTHPIVDSLYFTIMTICTIGYSDISPLTPSTKAFACVFVLLGFGFINILLTGIVTYVLDLQESMLLAGIQKGNRTHNLIRLKVGLAIGVMVLCIGIGGLGLYLLDNLDWIDSVYLAVMAVMTVGYGDRAFKTMAGRLFAVVWLLFSTLAVARAFLFLAEARVNKRQRRIDKWLLNRGFTVEDFVAAH